MNTTKDRIVNAAISLFNQFGYSKVSMQRLSSELGLSPGNLTYHFPKKEDLMMVIYKQFQEEMLLIIPPENENRPDLEGIDKQLRSFYKLQVRFLFFYLDLLEIERSYLPIATKHYDHINRQIDSNEAALTYNQGLGYLKKYQDDHTMRYLAEQIWFTAVFWPRQAAVRGIEASFQGLHNAIWRQIMPHLTQKGLMEITSILKIQEIRKES